jgi:hypothetical protein
LLLFRERFVCQACGWYTGRFPENRMSPRAALSIGCLGVVLAAAADAAADESRATLDWARMLSGAHAWVGRNAERAERGDLLGETPRQAVSTFGTAWFGVAPTVTIVARDWGQSHLLSGRLSVTEAMRLSRSSRMVVSRLRLAGGRITPFSQVGLGEWRIDRDLLPQAPRDVELAAQMGGGFEMQLVPGWELALESTATLIYREAREPQNVPTPRLFGTMLASRITF